MKSHPIGGSKIFLNYMGTLILIIACWNGFAHAQERKLSDMSIIPPKGITIDLVEKLMDVINIETSKESNTELYFLTKSENLGMLRWGENNDLILMMGKIDFTGDPQEIIKTANKLNRETQIVRIIASGKTFIFTCSVPISKGLTVAQLLRWFGVAFQDIDDITLQLK